LKCGEVRDVAKAREAFEEVLEYILDLNEYHGPMMPYLPLSPASRKQILDDFPLTLAFHHAIYTLEVKRLTQKSWV
jgi:hypothetical protein